MKNFSYPTKMFILIMLVLQKLIMHNRYFRKVISPGYGYVMDSWQFGGLHDNEEVAQRLPFMILRVSLLLKFN